MSSMMNAVFFHKHGEREVLEYGTLPVPTPAPGEALIRVKAVALNHLDIWVRRGWPGLHLSFPHITGSDIAGEVVTVEGESSFSKGDAVVVYPGWCGGDDEWTEHGEECVSPLYKIIGEHLPGGMAEYAVVPQVNLYPMISGREFTEAAAGLLTGLTTYRMLFSKAKLTKGEIVLVVGSGGGVNTMSLQMAKACGARVFCLAGSKAKEKRAREIGADEVILYRECPDWHKEVLRLTKGRGVDLVVDNVGHATLQKSIVATTRGGRIAIVGNTSGPIVDIDLRHIFSKQISILGSTMGTRKEFAESRTFLEQHKIVPVIDTVAPLADGIKMIERLEQGEQFGKIVLEP